MKIMWNGALCIVFYLGASSLFADQPNSMDANPQLNDPVRAFENIPMLGRKIEFRRRNTDLPGGGHFQGVQSYFAPSLNKQICFLSRDSDSKAYFITVAFDPGPQSCGEIRHVQYLPSDGKQPPLRHPGGMQLIGRYLVIGVEDNQNKRRSQVQFWDVSDPFAPKQRTPLTVIRESATPKDKTAGAVGIVRCARNHLLVVANWDAKALDFYVSNGLPLDDDACRFTFRVRWTNDEANKAPWKPNGHWGNYQGVNLVCDRDFKVYLFGFCTTTGEDCMDLFSVDLSKDPQNILRKLSSKRMLLQGGAHFQYSGGISIVSPKELSCYASERDDHDVTNVSVSP